MKALKRTLTFLQLAAMSALLGMIFTGCANSTTQFKSPPSATATPTQMADTWVVLTRNSFVPATIIIKVDTAVTWINDDSITHSVTSDNNLFNRSLNPKSTYTHVFKHAGTYGYHCNLHPDMIGAVIVQN